jgi:hypothetical protein
VGNFLPCQWRGVPFRAPKRKARRHRDNGDAILHLIFLVGVQRILVTNCSLQGWLFAANVGRGWLRASNRKPADGRYNFSSRYIAICNDRVRRFAIALRYIPSALPAILSFICFKNMPVQENIYMTMWRSDEQYYSSTDSGDHLLISLIRNGAFQHLMAWKNPHYRNLWWLRDELQESFQ